MAQESRASESAVSSPVPWYLRPRMFHSLRNKDWRRLWLAGHLWHTAFWMDLLVLGWIMAELTDSPFKVALIGTVRTLPIGVIGLFSGSQADRHSKKKILVAAQTMNLSATIILSVLLGLDAVQEWHLFVIASVTGCAYAIDVPVRVAFIREILPDKEVMNAFSLNSVSDESSIMAGRWLGGGFLTLAGSVLPYSFLSASYFLGLIILLSIPETPVAPRSEYMSRSVIQDLKEGLIYAWNIPAIRGVFIVTLLMNFLVFPYLPLTPVFARDVFEIGPGLFGLMSGMDGLGALIGSLILASMGNIRQRGAVFIIGSIILPLGGFLFAISVSYVMAMPMLALYGLGLAGFGTMQRAIPITIATPEMRGRSMGAIAFAIGLWPLGTIYVGALADRFGAPRAVAYNCIAALVLTLLVIVAQPGLRQPARSRVSGG